MDETLSVFNVISKMDAKQKRPPVSTGSAPAADRDGEKARLVRRPYTDAGQMETGRIKKRRALLPRQFNSRIREFGF
ncbi:MAG TPA: hypothetical protein VGB70_08775 [Allosphingosinicella sp.]|jgi:hypothetical protein